MPATTPKCCASCGARIFYRPDVRDHCARCVPVPPLQLGDHHHPKDDR